MRKNITWTALHEQEYNVLLEVVTRTEAARLWNRHPTTIDNAINMGHLPYRCTGRVILIPVASLNRLYGKPVKQK